MFVRSLLAVPPGRMRGAAVWTAALALGVALALSAPAALADSDYPPGLFENSPVVPHGSKTGDVAPSAAPGGAAAPSGAASTGGNAPPSAGASPNAALQPPDAGAPPEPYGAPPPAPVAPASPGAYGSPGTYAAPGTYAPPGTYGSPGDYAPPRAYGPPPAEVYAPPPYDDDYCATIASRTFGSLEEVRRAHARCDRATAAPPPGGYPPVPGW